VWKLEKIKKRYLTSLNSHENIDPHDILLQWYKYQASGIRVNPPFLSKLNLIQKVKFESTRTTILLISCPAFCQAPKK